MSKKKTTIIFIGIIVIAVCAIAYSFTPARKIAKQLDLGYKFLQEGNWEQAIVAFNNVIEIDENVEEAYIGAADAYANLGEMDNAIDVLRRGLERTEGENIIPKISDIYHKYAELLILDDEWLEAIKKLKEGYEEFLTEEILNELEELCIEYAEKLTAENKWDESIAFLEDINRSVKSRKITQKIEELKKRYAEYLMELKAETLLNSPNRKKRIEYISSAFWDSVDTSYYYLYLTDGIIKKNEEMYNKYIEELSIYRSNIEKLSEEEKTDLYRALIWYFCRTDIQICDEIISEAESNGISGLFPNGDNKEYDKYGRLISKYGNMYVYKYEEILLNQLVINMRANQTDMTISYNYNYDKDNILTEISAAYSRDIYSAHGFVFPMDMHFKYVDDYIVITMKQHYDDGDYPRCVKIKLDEFGRITELYMAETEEYWGESKDSQYLRSREIFATIDEYCQGAEYSTIQ